MSIKEKYYDYVLHRLKDSEVTNEEEIVFSILSDMTDRRNLRQAWESIDEDIQCEIIDEWIKIVKRKTL